MITFNNRSLLVLRQTGLKPAILRDRTGIEFYERELDKPLNGCLPSTKIRVREGSPGTSLVAP
jgi:hypothetical protein